VYSLFPGLGFFGSDASNCLKIATGEKPISAVRLSLTGGIVETLNIKRIQLIDRNGNSIQATSDELSAEMSSSIEGQGNPIELLSGKSIHSAREVLPWWMLTSTSPHILSEIHIFNRPDGWGRRARTIAVEVRTEDTWRRVYAADCHQHLATVLAAAINLSCGQFEVACQPLEGLSGLNSSLKLAILRAQGTRSIDITDIRSAMQLTPVYDSSQVKSIDLKLLAACLYSVRKRKGSVAAPHLINYSLMLSSPARILEMEGYLDEVAFPEKLIITKHGMMESVLTTKKDSYLKLAREIITLLKHEGLRSFIAYGTLLGAARTGEFIPFDDDIDLLYDAGCTSEEESVSGTAKMIELLQEHGFRAKRAEPHWHLHVGRGDVGVDLFPSWVRDGQFFLYMEKMKLRGIPVETIFPLSEISLYGEPFPAPASPTHFLAERYGPSWRTPDRFHEWPWALS
jgi:hypothetical protein